MQGGIPAMPAGRRPLRPTDLTPREQPPLAAAQPVIRLAARLPETIGALFAHLGQAAPRIAVEAVHDQQLAVPEDGGFWVHLECPSGPLRLLLMLDRPAVSGLCEAAMGGTGSEPPFEDGGRPLSRIETGLRDDWLSRCGEALTDLLPVVLACPLRPAAEPPGADDADSAAALDATSLRLLVNLFGYSGEMVLAFDRQQLKALLPQGQPDMPARDHAAVQRQLAEAPARIDVALPPETMCVQDVASLRPGSLLRLSARMSGPVIVSAAGHKLFSGLLEPSDGHLAVKLLDPVS